MADSSRTVRGEVMQGIALLTFQTPRRNALGAQSWQLLADHLDRYADDPAVSVVVMTGAGPHAFVTDPDAASDEDIEAHAVAAAHAREIVAAFPKPTISRVRGDCFGAGLLLAVHADLLIAAEDSAFSLPGARWGFTYPPSSVAALVHLVGPQQAKRLLFTGVRIDAREALRIGLATVVVRDQDLSDTVVDLARAIADNAPLAVAAAKRMVALPDHPANAGLAEQCRASHDHGIGLAAMRAGRKPVFTGT